MKIFIKVKGISKRRPIIDSISFEIDESLKNTNDLIAWIVRRNVQEFNQKPVDQPIFTYLTDDKISDLSKLGKIGFQDKKNENLQDEELAVENALQCFEDGIFKCLINGEEVYYNQSVDLKKEDELVFIRLTMLAGRLW